MDFRPAPIRRLDSQVIHTITEEALGSRTLRTNNWGGAVSTTWVANLAVFIPFGVSQPFLVREVFWFNGSAAGANIDVGIYDTAGNRLASLGTTAQSTASTVITSAAFTDYTIAPGDYFMAFACNGTTNTVGGWAPAANLAAAVGVGQMASAFVLPNPATIVPLTNALVPYFGLNGYTVAV
jgi:hypothetical protein